MNPVDLFVRGHPVIMLLITLAGGGVLFYSVRLWYEGTQPAHRRVVLLGALALLIGMLGQSIGLIQLLNAVEHAGEAPSQLVTGGITNTFIPLVYGAFWFVLALLIRYAKA